MLKLLRFTLNQAAWFDTHSGTYKKPTPFLMCGALILVFFFLSSHTTENETQRTCKWLWRKAVLWLFWLSLWSCFVSVAVFVSHLVVVLCSVLELALFNLKIIFCFFVLSCVLRCGFFRSAGWLKLYLPDDRLLLLYRRLHFNRQLFY